MKLCGYATALLIFFSSAQAGNATSRYTVNEIILPNGSPRCLMTFKGASTESGVSYSFQFIVGASKVSLAVYYRGTGTISPTKINVQEAGTTFASLPVNRRVGPTEGFYAFVADVPGDVFVKQIVPRLLNHEPMALQLDSAVLPVPKETMVVVVRSMSNCSARANGNK